MEKLNTVSTVLTDSTPVEVKVGDKLKLVRGDIVTVVKINPTRTGGWVLEAEMGNESHINLMAGRIVMLANQKYTIIKAIVDCNE